MKARMNADRTPQAKRGDVDASAFRRVLAHYPTGVCVVTATGDDGDGAALVVSSFTSVSLDPALVAFCPHRSSASWARIHRSGAFCVNVLAADQRALCLRFASKARDKFAGVSHQRSSNGSPRLDGIVAWIDCTLHAVHEAGDHFIVLGEVTSLQVEEADKPLVFFRGAYGGFVADANPRQDA